MWRDTGLTILFVTHNVREAVRLGDRVVLLSSRPGRVIREYPVSIARPRRMDSPEIAGLAASITDDHPWTRVPKNTLLMTTYAPNTKLRNDTSNPSAEIVRMGNDENDTNVSIAACTIRRMVHDDDPIKRRGRWYGTLVSRKPLHAIKPKVRRLRSLH